jgi:pimeloyl-ACP methyl ester carboxylesterase
MYREQAFRGSLKGSMLSFCLVAAAASSGAWAQNGPLFHFTEKPGPHAVGLKVVEQYDYSRTYRHVTDELGKPYRGERARPLQTLIWYPAERSGAKPMTVGDYGNLWATETTFGKPKMTSTAQDWLDGMSPTLALPLWAVRDASEAPGRFPVVIYAPSFSAVSWENADLCEYLASHGYVVIASPNMGASTRNMTTDLAGLDAQARDISFLIGYARTLPNTDVSDIAVAGFSWGGMSNLFAAARDNRIDALIALDGSLRYFASLIAQAGDVHPDRMTIPLLYFAQGEFTLEDQALYIKMNDGPNTLNSWVHGDLVTVRMLGMTHQAYSSMYQRNEVIWKHYFPKMQKADYGREDGIAGYAWTARYTLAFLNAYLRRDAVAMAYLKKTPAENGAPKHFMSVIHRQAKGLPASIQAFRAELGRVGFERIADVYATMQKQQTDFKLDEGSVTAWSLELIDGDHVNEAIALLKLNVQMHPESGGAHTSLGDAYRKAGKRQLAIDSYRHALEKDPSSLDAKRKLEELKGSAT